MRIRRCKHSVFTCLQTCLLGTLQLGYSFRRLTRCEPQIRDCFNESVVDAMIDQTVVCAGTIIGGRIALMSYLQLMSDVAHFVTKESCMAFGIDQVIT